ncbi:LytTR family two component transcriptional regulator [Arcicella aurantiaca]|uniref:LytTR family two component transcriptional regulator n=1 Tax=Arcicella aurantiaca TaxID=591202 RepID=A0A316DKJ4_9BACT|nr:LytTR family DNA-binding domain-containing protein [Arcicella aurantiaca]PWK18088.1 LytTR family two component transcriptional regulator [Arcicella aurantiaca]
MKKIRCIVLEDEEPAQNLMRNYFNRLPELELVEVFDNALEASDFLEDNAIDLIFTDIEMPRLSGLDFIRMLSPKPHVIIITAYPNFALEGFELDAIDYLKKPVSFDRFKKSVEKVQRLYGNSFSEENPVSIAMYVKESGRMIKIEFADILYIEGLGDYIKIITKERSIVTLSTLTKIIETLPATNFIRVHKSFIINSDKIDSIDSANSLVIMNDKKEITLGRAFKTAFISRFKAIN